jgi:hypothetical protein
MARRLSYRWLLGFLVVWGVLFGIWRLYQAPREAQARLAHMRHVLAVVAQYVRQHQGAWPRSWEEIEKTPVPPDAPPRLGTWPDVRNHVKVDFQVNPRKLLLAGSDQFQAISPRGRCGDYREDVQRLLEALRESLPPETGTEKASSSAAGLSRSKSAETAADAPQLRWKEASSPAGTISPDRSAKEPALPKDRPAAPSGAAKKSIAEPSSPTGKLPGLPEQTESKAEPSSPAAKLPGLPKETGPKPPTEKPPASQPTAQEKPAPNEKSPTQPSQPPRIILPGLD